MANPTLQPRPIHHSPLLQTPLQTPLYSSLLSPPLTPPSPITPPPGSYHLISHPHHHPTPASCKKRSYVNESASKLTTKRPRLSRAIYGLKNFTIIVAEKLRRYGVTSYTAVADELVIESQRSLCGPGSLYNAADIDKNVRRRVYDALNVFAATGFITRQGGKMVLWRGLQGAQRQMGIYDCTACGGVGVNGGCVCAAEVERRRREVVGVRERIAEKRRILAQMRVDVECLRRLIGRNLERQPEIVATGVLGEGAVEDCVRDVAAQGRLQLPFVLLSCKDCHIEMSQENDQARFWIEGRQKLVQGFAVVNKLMGGEVS